MVEIRDSGLPPLSSTAVVTVDIEDVNDCPPLFSESSYNATVQVCKQLPHINRQTRNRPNFFFNSWFIWVHGFKFWRDSLRAFGIMGMLFVIFQCCWWLSKTFFFLIWNLFEQRPPTGIVSFAANLENIFFWEISVGMYICRIYFFANIPCLTQFLLLTKVFFFL